MRTFDRVRVYAQFAALLPVSYEWLSGSLFVESMKRLAIDDADEVPEQRAIHLRSIIRPAVRRRTWPSRPYAQASVRLSSSRARIADGKLLGRLSASIGALLGVTGYFLR